MNCVNTVDLSRLGDDFLDSSALGNLLWLPVLVAIRVLCFAFLYEGRFLDGTVSAFLVELQIAASRLACGLV